MFAPKKRKESRGNAFVFVLFSAMLNSCSVVDFLPSLPFLYIAFSGEVHERTKWIAYEIHRQRRVKYGVNNIHILKIVPSREGNSSVLFWRISSAVVARHEGSRSSSCVGLMQAWHHHQLLNEGLTYIYERNRENWKTHLRNWIMWRSKVSVVLKNFNILQIIKNDYFMQRSLMMSISESKTFTTPQLP